MQPFAILKAVAAGFACSARKRSHCDLLMLRGSKQKQEPRTMLLSYVTVGEEDLNQQEILCREFSRESGLHKEEPIVY